MSKATGIKGKTPEQLRRSQDAEQRERVYEQRSTEEQLAELDTRPGNAAKERKRLGG